ncbi:30S ribosomal protein S19 [Candidatus Pacearchaeota archaeon]|nr:30S ribosomal protein S19 [Candidatus Pacearchaeota archaeon]
MVEEVIVRSKELFYRGKNLEDLKKMDVRESAKFLPSRSRRTVLRNFDMIEKFIKRCEKKVSMKKKIRTHLRDIVIVPHLVGQTIQVYNGRTFNEVKVSAAMIGHRLGEFSLTRGKVTHGTPGIGATKSSAGEKK